MTTLRQQLESLRPCQESLDWIGSRRSAARAWAECERGDWMLWLLGRLAGPLESESRRRLVLCACECARLSLHYVPAGEDRPRVAIETAERWARCEAGVTLDDVRAAAYAAAYAADAADAAVAVAYAADAAYAAYAYAAYAYAADAAYAAAYAADAAYAAACAAYAADAAVYAAYAADAAAYAADARARTLRECADIVRRHYPEPPVIPAREVAA